MPEDLVLLVEQAAVIDGAGRDVDVLGEDLFDLGDAAAEVAVPAGRGELPHGPERAADEDHAADHADDQRGKTGEDDDLEVLCRLSGELSLITSG
jgi:hypothetical protein